MPKIAWMGQPKMDGTVNLKWMEMVKEIMSGQEIFMNVKVVRTPAL